MSMAQPSLSSSPLQSLSPSFCRVAVDFPQYVDAGHVYHSNTRPTATWAAHAQSPYRRSVTVRKR